MAQNVENPVDNVYKCGQLCGWWMRSCVKKGGTINEYLQTGGDLHNGSDGKIGDLKQTGGQSDNDGQIDHAQVSDINHYRGNLPKDGLDGVEASVTYVDESGNKKTEYFPSLKDALEKAGEGMGDYYEEDKDYLIIRTTGLFNGCL